MQFSKYTGELSRRFNVGAKEIYFAMLIAAGASKAEAYAIVYRPTISTNQAMSKKAGLLIQQNPGLDRLITYLCRQLGTGQQTTPTPTKPAADQPTTPAKPTNPRDEIPFDYTDKDAILLEMARETMNTTGTDRVRALRELAEQQLMKQEKNFNEEKRVHFYIPLSYERAEELTEYLKKWYESK
jgi:hypothetical protein